MQQTMDIFSLNFKSVYWCIYPGTLIISVYMNQRRPYLKNSSYQVHVHRNSNQKNSKAWVLANTLNLVTNIIKLLSFLILSVVYIGINKGVSFIISVPSLNRIPLFVTPWIAARQASLSITNSWSSLKLHVHRVGDAIQPSHPLLSPSPSAPNPSQHQGLFQWVNSSPEVAYGHANWFLKMNFATEYRKFFQN